MLFTLVLRVCPRRQALRDGHAAPGPAGASESAIAVGAAKEAHEVGASEHSLQVCTAQCCCCLV